tara:strand:- start:1415 stop:2251 length:837 start_codon:yes stop_codon:yes gene_type:complete
MQKSKKNICILGGNDNLTNSFYSYCKNKFNKIIYINLSNEKVIKNLDNNIFNLKIYELRKCLDVLNKNFIDEIVLIGKISRPDLSKFKLDGVLDKYMNKLINAYTKGDGEILNLVISIFSEKGFKIVPITSLTSNFSFNKFNTDRIFNKNKCDQKDIKKALRILNDLSKYDNAQSIVIDNGFILSIEAAEGTDEMLDRVFKYKKKMKLLKNSSGIFVKLPKKNQSLKADMPVIGPKTIKLLRKSKINSIAVSRFNTLVNDLNKTLLEVEKNKINLYLI